MQSDVSGGKTGCKKSTKSLLTVRAEKPTITKPKT
jgi:hypothetical protein